MMKPTTPIKSPLPNTIRVVILVGITIVLVYWLLAPNKARQFQAVSLADLQGVWTTTHPRYQGRYLQFSDGLVAFGWGEAGAGAYTIDEFDCEPAKTGSLVHIRYVDTALTEFQLNLNYVDQNGGIIWIKSQNGVYWVRTSKEPIYNPALK